jgi:valyl-tRNA synthetase
MRLLHPVVPFITEELWQKLPGRATGELLAAAAWPVAKAKLRNPRAEAEFERVRQAIAAVRSIRAEYRVSPKTKLDVSVKTSDGAVLAAEKDTIIRLAGVGTLDLDGSAKRAGGAHAVLPDGSEVFVALAGVVDVTQDCKRLKTELERLDKQLAGLAAKLGNESFVARAPADVVAKEREKEQSWRTQRTALADRIKSLGCA